MTASAVAPAADGSASATVKTSYIKAFRLLAGLASVSTLMVGLRIPPLKSCVALSSGLVAQRGKGTSLPSPQLITSSKLSDFTETGQVMKIFASLFPRGAIRNAMHGSFTA